MYQIVNDAWTGNEEEEVNCTSRTLALDAKESIHVSCHIYDIHLTHAKTSMTEYRCCITLDPLSPLARCSCTNPHTFLCPLGISGSPTKSAMELSLLS